MKWIAGVPFVLALVSASGLSAHDGHDDVTEQTFKVGNKGEVKFGEDVKMGGFLVKKGRYVLEHHIDGARHLLVLTSAERREAQVAVTYEVSTEVVSSKLPVKKSAIYAAERDDHELQVAVVQILGENIDHLPIGTVAATR
jgi:hypothetical protein